MRADVVVVGGGPAGSAAASELAGSCDVVIVEEHAEPGRPVQCAGLVTPRGVPDFARDSVISSVRGARIHSPKGFTLTIESDDVRAHVIDRAVFDKALFDRAVDRGARPMLSTRVRAVRDGDSSVVCDIVSSTGHDTLESSVVVGADGHRSVCRSAAKMATPRHMLRGIQADLKGVDIDPGFVELYLGRTVAPGFFAWAIPAGDMVRVGLCVSDDSSPSAYLSHLLSRPEFSGSEVIRKSSGRIPIGAGRTAVRGRILLAGDAACHAKPLSGGGVFTGVTGGRLCGQLVRDHIADPSATLLQSYDEAWKDVFGQELLRAFRIRRVFLALNDKKMDQALRMFDDPDVRALIESRGDIDYPSALSSSVLKLAPKLARFSPQLIKSLL